MSLFTLQHQDAHSQARAGILQTAHGQIETPIFMPVGTQGTVKSLNAFQLHQIGSQIILGNTYHLYLRPGIDTFLSSQGLHKFQNWNKPILTDSGGFQVFSLQKIRKITEEGVSFQSHIDGSKHFFSPRSVMNIQRHIGADIMMAFDECTPYPCDYAYAKQSLKKTHRWLDECIQDNVANQPLYGYEQLFFPIVQGSVFADLRKESCLYVAEKNQVGYAIGGLSVGEDEQTMYEMTNLCCEHLPTNKPRYLMGVGTPKNILNCIELGIDMFDCVMPTRNGRNGMLFTTQGIINITNQKWKNDFSPIDEGLTNAPLSLHYSKSYLRHLFMSNELLALQIASMQNLAFYLHLVKQARIQIVNNNFSSWKTNILDIITQRL